MVKQIVVGEFVNQNCVSFFLIEGFESKDIAFMPDIGCPGGTPLVFVSFVTDLILGVADCGF